MVEAAGVSSSSRNCCCRFAGEGHTSSFTHSSTAARVPEVGYCIIVIKGGALKRTEFPASIAGGVCCDEPRCLNMAAGKGNLEKLQRAVRITFFIITMVASLLVLSAPVLVAVGDALGSLVLASRFACASCYSLREHFDRYGFRSSLMDIPLISVVRSLVITCVYSLCDGPGLSHGPYLGVATFCSFASIIILSVKACVFSPILEIESEDTSPSVRQKLYLKKSWGLPVLFLFSLVFALGHVMVAYRTSCRARRKLLFHRIDLEAVLAYKNVFLGYTKVPRSPTPCNGRLFRSDSEAKRKDIAGEENDLPISLLADADSLFIACQGLTLHYKLSSSESPLCHSLSSTPFLDSSPNCSPRRTSPGKHKVDRPLTLPSKFQHQISRSLNNQPHSSTLYAPLLAGLATSPTFFSDEIPVLSLDDNCDKCSLDSQSLETDIEQGGKFGVVLVHGFGGGVFSWRHVMGALARQLGYPVVAFDRPGWGLTSRPRRKEWEEKQLANPYKLEAQVDLLLSFCTMLGFSSVVLVGHDDGGLLVLKAAERLRESTSFNVKVKGVGLLSVSLSREVVPAFARILLHTSLGKKHMVRPLLRTEITQVINRRAWYDATKLTAEVLNFYKAPLCIEGWDEALHEIGRLSFSTVLSPQNAALLLKSIEDLPVLIVAGAEDMLVPLKSAQVMASGFANSRLVAISGCGHLPHEECPKALLGALSPFITRLLSSPDMLQHQ